MNNKTFETFVVVVVILIFITAPFVHYWKSEAQRLVYEREGIHMTTFEIMMGAKPAERVITIQEKK